MKKTLAILLVLAMAMGMVACGGADQKTTAAAPDTTTEAQEQTTAAEDPYADLKPVTLLLADASAKGAAAQMLGDYITERVSEITGGKLTIDYHPNSELGGDADLLRQLKDGDIDLNIAQTAPSVSFIPELAVFDLPMVFAKYDGEVIDKVLNGDNAFTKALQEAEIKAGFYNLGFMQNATYRLTSSNTELKTLADFKNLQIRTMQNTNHMAFWQAIEAEPTPLAWTEVFFALQTGTIDAEENAADTIYGANLQDVQKYLCLTNHILYNNEIKASAKTMEKLDPAYQEALKQAVADGIAYMQPMLKDIDKQNKDLLAEKMTIIEYDADFYDSILNLDGVKALYKQIDEEQVNGLGTLLQNELEAAAK